MKKIKVKVSETILKNEYVSMNGEESDGFISLIPKDEWNSMMKEGLDLINSTQVLIDSLKG